MVKAQQMQFHFRRSPPYSKKSDVNNTQHPQNDVFRSDSYGTDVLKAPQDRKGQTMRKTPSSTATRWLKPASTYGTIHDAAPRQTTMVTVLNYAAISLSPASVSLFFHEVRKGITWVTSPDFIKLIPACDKTSWNSSMRPQLRECRRCSKIQEKSIWNRECDIKSRGKFFQHNLGPQTFSYRNSW